MLFLASCGAADDGNGPAPVFRLIAGDAIYSMTMSNSTPTEAMIIAAKERCGSREFCQIFAWTSGVDTARAFPMTDNELKNLAFRYAINRTTGYESRMWDCSRWPRENADECISKP